MKRTVAAIGGNSLIEPGGRNGNRDTHELAREVCEELAVIARDRGSLVVTHGNGPQVGFELLRNARARDIVPPDGMDVNVAATQGYIGYLLQQVLGDVLEEMGVDIPVTSLITQVVVHRDDPGFDNPTKPEDVLAVLPYAYACHAKFNYVDENFEEKTIPYEEVLNIMVSNGWSGFLLSEYEGPQRDDFYFLSDQLRRQHIMMSRILGY